MKTKITCPVCNQSNIEEDFCSRCDTDLSGIRMLAELPPISTKQKPLSAAWLPATLAILILLMGIIFGASGNYLFSRLELPIATTVRTPVETVVKPNQSSLPTATNSQSKAGRPLNRDCLGGFRYTVRRGDYLWIIADRFYGDGNLWKLIADANPNLKTRTNLLREGEVLIVPNRQEDSCEHL